MVKLLRQMVLAAVLAVLAQETGLNGGSILGISAWKLKSSCGNVLGTLQFQFIPLHLASQMPIFTSSP